MDDWADKLAAKIVERVDAAEKLQKLWHAQWTDSEAEIDELKAQNAVMRAALIRLSPLWTEWEDFQHMPDDMRFEENCSVTIADMRAAQAVLESGDAGKPLLDVVEALDAVLKWMDEAKPFIDAVCSMSQLHGFPYGGPSWQNCRAKAEVARAAWRK